MIKKIICLIMASVFIMTGALNCDAREQEDYKSISELLKSIDCEHIAVFEVNTGEVLGSRKGGKKVYISHLTKLMTALIVYDMINESRILEDTVLTTSEYANSQQGVQIWLDVGEEISVKELLYAITVSNANDAAVVLAEGCCGNEKKFVSLMNKRAKALGMKDTTFADCTGIDEKNISTAKDMCILIGELAKNNVFADYYKTRITEVGRKASQLVTQNRLIDNYKGICGYKAFYSEKCSDVVCCASKQRDMTVCLVMIGCKDEDIKFSDAKSIMNYAFNHFEIYYPEIPEDVYTDIPVLHGQKAVCPTDIGGSRDIIIERGSYRQIYTDFSYAEELTAPVRKGDKTGTLVFYDAKGEILKCDIVAAQDIEEMDFLFALKSLLYNLFNI
ncbi:MAG: D-alanyl-D-alanine carboxypeptidase [Ruminococcus sp.]|nr:D-alanyl-D-alanine carboxypeptidase [Ruminococcus sp.]